MSEQLEELERERGIASAASLLLSSHVITQNTKTIHKHLQLLQQDTGYS